MLGNNMFQPSDQQGEPSIDRHQSFNIRNCWWTDHRPVSVEPIRMASVDIGSGVSIDFCVDPSLYVVV
ncbi:hypothetical protein F2Q69_00022660 [Brassica cretica]|uniref:Uncharacterized protein n=1 Tax=Brassica cretica TaxID=69181 RepID=A0A8S9Q4A5_BRACR|nr:hypothetical protein F2Q69_00022660 [Brassica cretica]